MGNRDIKAMHGRLASALERVKGGAAADFEFAMLRDEVCSMLASRRNDNRYDLVLRAALAMVPDAGRQRAMHFQADLRALDKGKRKTDRNQLADTLLLAGSLAMRAGKRNLALEAWEEGLTVHPLRKASHTYLDAEEAGSDSDRTLVRNRFPIAFDSAWATGLQFPIVMRLDQENDTVWICDHIANHIKIFTPHGGVLFDGQYPDDKASDLLPLGNGTSLAAELERGGLAIFKPGFGVQRRIDLRSLTGVDDFVPYRLRRMGTGILVMAKIGKAGGPLWRIDDWETSTPRATCVGEAPAADILDSAPGGVFYESRPNNTLHFLADGAQFAETVVSTHDHCLPQAALVLGDLRLVLTHEHILIYRGETLVNALHPSEELDLPPICLRALGVLDRRDVRKLLVLDMRSSSVFVFDLYASGRPSVSSDQEGCR